MTFGNRLRQARKMANLSGTELGQKLVPSVSKQTISHWEHESHRPDLEYLPQLCAVLHTTADALILGDMKRQTEEAIQIAEWINDLSKAERKKWVDILRMALRPPIDEEKVIEATPKRPISDFQKLR